MNGQQFAGLISDPDRIFLGAESLAVKSDAGQAADAGPVSFSDIESVIVLNYTGALAERQLKRSLRIPAPFDRPDLLFDGPFTIIRSFRLAMQEGARLNDERGSVGAN